MNDMEKYKGYHSFRRSLNLTIDSDTSLLSAVKINSLIDGKVYVQYLHISTNSKELDKVVRDWFYYEKYDFYLREVMPNDAAQTIDILKNAIDAALQDYSPSLFPNPCDR